MEAEEKMVRSDNRSETLFLKKQLPLNKDAYFLCILDSID